MRVQRQEVERQIFSPFASFSEQSKGRAVPEPECEIRTCYQRDIDRITHCKAFRRLKHKTQVFLKPEGDHYRTRITHTLEVMRIGRTIARALRLNEDLIEAVALGHDLGHTPFGHAGERSLNEIIQDAGGFQHNEQSLRVVDKFEKDGKGLNLTFEVKDGIRCHTGHDIPSTPEGSIIRLADRIAYLNHDVDDAIRAGILTESDLPQEISHAFGVGHSERINSLILDVIRESEKRGQIAMSPQVADIFNTMREFMFEAIYFNVRAKSEEVKVHDFIFKLFEYYSKNTDKLPPDYRRIIENDGLDRAVADYVSGMTDGYAIFKYNELFVPRAWGGVRG